MESAKKNVNHKKSAAAILLFLRGSKVLFLISIALTCVTALADMVIPQIIKISVDNIIGGRPFDGTGLVSRAASAVVSAAGTADGLLLPALAVVAVAAVKVVSQYFFKVSSSRATETFVKTARDTLFSHIASLPFSWHVKNSTGDIIQRCTSDIETVKSFIAFDLTQLFRISVFLVLSTVFMFGMNPQLAGIAVLSTPFILLNSVIFARRIENGFRAFDENEGRLSAVVQENLTGVRVVRAFGREKRELDAFRRQNAGYTVLGEKVGRDMGMYWGLADIIVGLQQLIVLAAGAYFCVHGRMTAGQLIAFFSYNSMLAWPMNHLGRIIMSMGKAGISVERVSYIMNSEPEKPEPDESCPPLDGDIVFDNVSFSYDGSPAVLDSVSFTVKAGTTLGILGGTGSGKSTLMLLLDKLYPLPEGSGVISIGGTDIRKIRTGYLRENIGMVLQEPFLFSGTISENIAVTAPSAERSDIEKAAADACLDEAVGTFARGYDTFVGERGVTLSGGQKQRAAIARVLIKSRPILVFDDSTSAVDTETDAKIRASLVSRFGSATIIIISHRISTLSKADKIIVLENGRIAEEGTHARLLKNGGLYRQIYDIQTLGGQKDEK